MFTENGFMVWWRFFALTICRTKNHYICLNNNIFQRYTDGFFFIYFFIRFEFYKYQMVLLNHFQLTYQIWISISFAMFCLYFCITYHTNAPLCMHVSKCDERWISKKSGEKTKLRNRKANCFRRNQIRSAWKFYVEKEEFQSIDFIISIPFPSMIQKEAWWIWNSKMDKEISAIHLMNKC